MTTAIVYSPRYLDHDTGPGHPESPSRLKTIMDSTKKSRLLETGNCALISPRKAKSEEVELVHDQSYVKMIRVMCMRGGGQLDEDTTLSSESYDVALLAAGGVLKASELVLTGKFENAFALVRPPGHHVGFCGCGLSATSQGFCVFNNVAIAAMNLIKKHDLKRILILDTDVHHGNGTQEIFNETSSILYMSLHQYGIYPHTGYADEIGYGEGEGFKVNIPFPARSGDDVWLKSFDEIVIPISLEYEPEFILVSIGFDCHKEDPLAGMRLSTVGILEGIDRILSIASKTCAGKLVLALEGGYNLKVLSKAVPLVIKKLAGEEALVEEERAISNPKVKNEVETTLKEIKEILLPYWKTLKS